MLNDGRRSKPGRIYCGGCGGIVEHDLVRKPVSHPGSSPGQAFSVADAAGNFDPQDQRGAQSLQATDHLKVHGYASEQAAALLSETQSSVARGAEASADAHRQASDKEVIVECRGIEFGYGMGPKVLRNVDLAVRRGDIHGLIGPNGSGKSTLANIIAGRLRPHSGTTVVKGLVVDGLSPSGRARLGLRRTFQAAQLVRELTTSQNVLVGRIRACPVSSGERRSGQCFRRGGEMVPGCKVKPTQPCKRPEPVTGPTGACVTCRTVLSN
jgi:ABC-type glutathione transport system ATPase component